MSFLSPLLLLNLTFIVITDLNFKSQTIGQYPLIYKLENKLINLASKGWSKLTNSKQSVNQKSYHLLKITRYYSL